MERIVVEFIKNCAPYRKGDIAGINKKLSQKLVKEGYAIECKIGEEIKEEVESEEESTKTSKTVKTKK